MVKAKPEIKDDARPTSPQPFETLRYDPAAATGSEPADDAPFGFVRLGLHLDRLERSAGWLGFGVDREAVVAAMRAAVEGSPGPQRVRVTFAGPAEIAVTATPLAMDAFRDTPAAALAAAEALLAAGGSLPSAALARQRVDETDPARAHKTTSRALYYAGRAVAERLGLDDVLFLDSRGRLAEGSISSVFVVEAGPAGSAVWTPPLSSGALPGVLRQSLLRRGLIAERELREEDLRSAAAVLLGSSVRGLRRVELLADLVEVG